MYTVSTKDEVVFEQEARHKKSILPMIRQEARHVVERTILIGQGAQQAWHKECTSTARETRSGPLVVETANSGPNNELLDQLGCTFRPSPLIRTSVPRWALRIRREFAMVANYV